MTTEKPESKGKGGGKLTRSEVVTVRMDSQLHYLAELAARKAAWKPRETDYASGTLWKYAQQVGSAEKGAVTHPGGKAEKHMYADI